ncbi:MAG: DUF58 domain-containing protein [Chloroflexi bacterium]|nr:DUF58 domain-containing protein [Chloroflexota bacterium]
MSNRLLVLLGVLALASAFANGFGLLFRLAYVIGGVIVFGALWAWMGVHWLSVSVKRGAERCKVGLSFQDAIEIRNVGWLPKLWLEAKDDSDFPGRDATAVIGLAPGKAKVWKLQTTCRKRGKFTLGPVTLACSDPFGLFRWERNLGKPHTVLVHPATVALPRFSPQPALLLGEGPHRRRTRNVTPNAAGVRDYAFGDSFNRIHWRSTARTGRLMVKEFEFDPSSDMWILLDAQRCVQAGSGDESTEEYGVTVAASIAKRFLEGGRSVGLVAQGEQLDLLRAEKGMGQLSRIMEALALIQAEGDVSFADVISREAKRLSRHSTVIAITPSTGDAWVAQLRYLMSHRISVTAVLLDASSFGGYAGPASTLARLAGGGIRTYLVKRGDVISKSLSEPHQADLAFEMAAAS